MYIRGNRFSSFAVGIYAWDFTSIDVIGNGVADDTTAINTALAVLNSTLGGTLYFPRGTYKITSTLVIPILVGGASLKRY